MVLRVIHILRLEKKNLSVNPCMQGTGEGRLENVSTLSTGVLVPGPGIGLSRDILRAVHVIRESQPSASRSALFLYPPNGVT